VTNEFYDEHSPNSNIDFKKVEAHVYQMESHHAHNSYASILECINPCTEDYDFEGFTGFYRTKFALEYSRGTMTATNIALGTVYSFLLKDLDSSKKINKILIKYDPNINQSVSDEIFEQFSKSS
jgi:hypothetical protein